MIDNSIILTSARGVAREAHLRAAQIFTPTQLSKFIEQDGDISVVDADKLLECLIDNGVDRAFPLFCIVLNDMYRWDYSTPPEVTTIYFEPSATSGVLFGGVYDQSTSKRKTRVAIAKVEGSEQRAPYTYTEEDFTKLLNNLKQNA